MFILIYRPLEVCKTGKIGNKKSFRISITIFIASSKFKGYYETVSSGTSQFLIHNTIKNKI